MMEFLDTRNVSLYSLIIRAPFIDFEEEFEIEVDLLTAELVRRLVKMIQRHSKTLEEFGLDVPCLQDCVKPFLDYFHRAWVLAAEDDGFPALMSLNFQAFWGSEYWKDASDTNSSRWTVLLPILQVVQVWCQHRRVNTHGSPALRHLKVGLPDFEREFMLDTLKEEVKAVLEVEFLGPYHGNKPPAIGCRTIDWHLQD
ncbi:hypothetical protein CPB83DRAFT_245499 [Crepidotus variabilis]|uniref:Uncharacterized protein n=1 Tax=Crepidotus variabilis TaxID=179855 RepID=A0A9P6E2Y9_9AGAR|nr:hypothetical protein CPB83DRAFT_245499 [Crepidotus variabilis]